MKFTLFNLLNVFLATSGLVAPAQAAFGQRVEPQIVQHLVCVKEGQHFLCEVERSGEGTQRARPLGYRQVVLNKGAVPATTQSHKSSAVNVVPPLLSPAQQKSIANILLGFIYFVLPCGFVLGIFLYDKYYVYRTAVLHKQIELLERLYVLDNDATTNTEREANEQIQRLEKLWQSDSDNDATTDTGRGTKGL